MSNRKGRKNYHAILCYGKPEHEEYRGYQINLGSGKKDYSDSYREIIEKLILNLENSLEYFSSVYIVRFDLMFNDLASSVERPASKDVGSQIAINWFCANVKRYLLKIVKKTRDKCQQQLRNHNAVCLNWVREYSRNKGFHYHCYIILDANKLCVIGESSDTISSLKSLIEHYWSKAVIKAAKEQGCIANPCIHINSGNKRATYIIRNKSKDRGSKDIQRAVYHLSYLAKVRSKLYHSEQGGALHTHSISLMPSQSKTANLKFRNRSN